MSMEWANYFGNQRSEQLNAIIGICIGFIFGFVSILSNEVTGTILAFFAFTIIITVMLGYFYRKYQFYKAWEDYSRANEINNADYEQRKREFLTPDSNEPVGRSSKLSNLVFRYLIPKHSFRAGIQCLIWVTYIALLLLWENNTIQVFLGFIPPVHLEIFNSLIFGYRHVFFAITFIASIVVTNYRKRE